MLIVSNGILIRKLHGWPRSLPCPLTLSELSMSHTGSQHQSLSMPTVSRHACMVDIAGLGIFEQPSCILQHHFVYHDVKVVRPCRHNPLSPRIAYSNPDLLHHVSGRDSAIWTVNLISGPWASLKGNNILLMALPDLL